MPLSNLEVANYALQKLGAKRVESFDQDHPNARSISAVFDLVRRAELRKHIWNFAVRRATLAADTAQTDWGSHNRFRLPTGYLRLIFDDETGEHVDWTVESDAADGKFIITDDDAPLYIKYIHDVDTPALYDDLFVEAIACKMAYEMCREITGSSEQKAQLYRDYNDALGWAAGITMRERVVRETPESVYLTARR